MNKQEEIREGLEKIVDTVITEAWWQSAPSDVIYFGVDEETQDCVKKILEYLHSRGVVIKTGDDICMEIYNGNPENAPCPIIEPLIIDSKE